VLRTADYAFKRLSHSIYILQNDIFAIFAGI
jgi:hypothetical protein